MKNKKKEGYRGIRDEDVQKMLKEWDKVTCKYCGKEISILKARAINGGQYFVCKSH